MTKKISINQIKDSFMIQEHINSINKKVYFDIF